MAERKTGAGSHLSGVLERTPPPRSEPTAETEVSPAESSPKGRGPSQGPKQAKTPPARVAKRIKGRTVYLADDLFERIIVQAHRRDLTISDYIAMLLERHVPDHRVVRSGSTAATVDPSEDQDAA